MRDLIDRAEAIKKRSPQERLIIAKTLIESVLDELPSAQPEIIRCKDCEWYREGKLLSPNKFCYRLKDNDGNRIGYNFADNDFCSRAERKE